MKAMVKMAMQTLVEMLAEVTVDAVKDGNEGHGNENVDATQVSFLATSNECQ